MRRRILLGAFGGNLAATAGCSALVKQFGESQPTSTEPGSDGSGKRVEIVGTQPEPDDLGIELSATMVASTMTKASPARLRTTLENTGPTREFRVGDREYCHLFNRGHAMSDPPGLWLYRPVDRPARAGSSCWRPADPQSTAFVSIGCPTTTLETGDTITMEYEVWDDAATPGCLAPESYRFATPDLFSQTEAASDGPSYVWRMELRVHPRGRGIRLDDQPTATTTPTPNASAPSVGADQEPSIIASDVQVRPGQTKTIDIEVSHANSVTVFPIQTTQKPPPLEFQYSDVEFSAAPDIVLESYPPTWRWTETRPSVSVRLPASARSDAFPGVFTYSAQAIRQEFAEATDTGTVQIV